MAVAFAAGQALDTNIQVKAPTIPEKDFNLKDFGAVPDGTTLNTKAFADAMEAISKAGGGRLVIPAGKYLTGPIQLVSSLDFHLEEGATILMSDDTRNYKLFHNDEANREDFEDCIYAKNAHDLRISGKGTIDGQGKMWWQNFVKPKNAPADAPTPAHRPYMLVITQSQRVHVSGVTLQNSPSFHLVPGQCEDLLIEDIKILAPQEGKNTDGIDPSGHNIIIRRCYVDCGDDNIVMKPSRIIPGKDISCLNVLIEDCTLKKGHGLSIGGQTPGGLRNMIVRNCSFEGTEAGIRMKAPRGNGGVVENLTYENLTMTKVKNPILITSYYPKLPFVPTDDPAQPVTATSKTPVWRKIRINNLKATDCEHSVRVIGLAEMFVDDVVLENVNISSKRAGQINFVKDIRFINCNLDTQLTDSTTKPATQTSKTAKPEKPE